MYNGGMKFIPIALTLFLLASCGGSATPLDSPGPAPVQLTSPAPEQFPAHPTLAPGDFSIIGYFPDYRELNPAWAKNLTDIIYFSAEPRVDGSLDVSRLTDENWQSLQQMKTEHAIRLHLSIGGWERGTDDFAAMTSDLSTRQVFISNLLNYLLARNLDGADFDWEFPQDPEEFANYIALLTEIKSSFSEHGLLVSVALPAEASFPLAGFAVADRIHIMAYDHPERHSTYEQAVQDFQIFLDAGIPPEKLILGMPFYARAVDDFDKEASYADIVGHYQPAPDVDEIDGWYFNGVTTIQQKTCFAKNQHAGGVMFWELGQDMMDETSLLQAIYETALNEC